MLQPLATNEERNARRKSHFVAATFYLLIAVVAVGVAVSGKPATLVVAALAGAYSIYLYRGGRVVVWFW